MQNPTSTNVETCSRRTFCQAAAASLTLALAGRAATAAATEFPRGRYVDIHTHLGQTWNHTEPLSADGLRRWEWPEGIKRVSIFADAGEAGHINAESGHGPWPEGSMTFAHFMTRL